MSTSVEVRRDSPQKEKLVMWSFAVIQAVIAYMGLEWVHAFSGYLNLIAAVILGLLTILNYGMSALFLAALLPLGLFLSHSPFAIAYSILLALVWAFGKGDRKLLALAYASPIFVYLHLSFVPVILALLLSNWYGGLYVGLSTVSLCGLMAYTAGVNFEGLFTGPIALIAGPLSPAKSLALHTATVTATSASTTRIVTHGPLWVWKTLFGLAGETLKVGHLSSAPLQKQSSETVNLLRGLPAGKASFIEGGVTSYFALAHIVQKATAPLYLAFISPILMYLANLRKNLNLLVHTGIQMAIVVVAAAVLLISGHERTSIWVLPLIASCFLVMLIEMVIHRKELGVAGGYGLTRSGGTVAGAALEALHLRKSSDESIAEIANRSAALRDLDGIIGIEQVKDFVREIQSLARIERMRGSGTGMNHTWHMILTGNPGTGKTTVARIIGKVLQEEKILTTGQFVEVGREDLVAPYVGQTAAKTLENVQKAIGGVLFIDEAYSLVRGDQTRDFGREAIDTLVKAMEEHRHNLVVILAGYPDEMESFLKSNPGLRSRFPNQIAFPDYTPDEVFGIMKKMLDDRSMKLAEGTEPYLVRQIERSQLKGRVDAGNGRLARNLVEAALRNQSARLSKLPSRSITKDMLSTLERHDFGFQEGPEDADMVLDRLQGMIGLDEVKTQMRTLHALLVTQNRRRQAGLQVDTHNLHTLFTGNPGTGKTTVARIYAEMLHSLDFLKKGHLVEADRSRLVAGYQGQTAIKVREVFEEAMGGVLFIDEAYTLVQSDRDQFGLEAVDTLMKLMEDFRGEIVVILAGYDDRISEFLKVNPGLQSRFANHIRFPNYTLDELREIAEREFTRRGYKAEQEALSAVQRHMDKERGSDNFGNARAVVNLVERTIRNHAVRVAATNESSMDALTIVLVGDVV